MYQTTGCPWGRLLSRHVEAVVPGHLYTCFVSAAEYFPHVTEALIVRWEYSRTDETRRLSVGWGELHAGGMREAVLSVESRLSFAAHCGVFNDSSVACCTIWHLQAL